MNRIRHSRSGYILLELVIALTIFAIAVLGLAKSLNMSLEVSNQLNRENAIRIGMRSFLEECRKKPTTSEMAMSAVDERLGVTFSSLIDPAGLTNSSGKTLADLYKLTVTATYATGGAQEEQSVMVYVYQPQTQSR